MAPDQKSEDGDGDAGERDELVAEDRLACEKQGMISLTTPIPGRIMMYTAGCE